MSFPYKISHVGLEAEKKLLEKIAEDGSWSEYEIKEIGLKMPGMGLFVTRVVTDRYQKIQ